MLFRHGRAHGVIVSYEEIDAKDKAGEAINKRNFVTLVILVLTSCIASWKLDIRLD